MLQVQVIQLGGDFYVSGDGDEFRVSAPFDVTPGDQIQEIRAYGWFSRVCEVAGYDPHITQG
jgi:hypothetical protein